MQTFFNKLSPISYGVVRYTEWNYIKLGLLRNLQTIEDYYKNRVLRVRSNHFLSRLLLNLNVPLSLPLERFYDNVDIKANDISMFMKMTSPIYKGSVFSGGFYGLENPEIYISDSTYFNPFNAYKNWKNVCAVKPLMHPRSDLSLLLPNGRDTSSETGLAVIAINIPLLAVQYKAFCDYQARITVGTDQGMLGRSHFIHMYVLPNMLKAHTDIVVFNRLNNLSKGAPLGESKREHPFALPSYISQMNSVHEMIIRDMTSKKQVYEMLLRTIPMIEKDNLEESMLLPDIAPTRQVMWAEIISRLDALEFMIRVGGKEAISANGTTLNYLVKTLSYIRMDRSIETYLPYGLYIDTKYRIKEMFTNAGMGAYI